MCNGLAKFLRKRTAPHAQLDVIGIQSEEGQAMIETFPPRMQTMDTLYVVRAGETVRPFCGRHPPSSHDEMVLCHAVSLCLVGSAAPSGRRVLGRVKTSSPVWPNRRLEVKVQHQRCVVGHVQTALSYNGAIGECCECGVVEQEVVNSPTSILGSGLTSIGPPRVGFHALTRKVAKRVGPTIGKQFREPRAFVGKETRILRVPLRICLLYTSPSPRDVEESRMPSSA